MITGFLRGFSSEKYIGLLHARNFGIDKTLIGWRYFFVLNYSGSSRAL